MIKSKNDQALTNTEVIVQREIVTYIQHNLYNVLKQLETNKMVMLHIIL